MKKHTFNRTATITSGIFGNGFDGNLYDTITREIADDIANYTLTKEPSFRMMDDGSFVAIPKQYHIVARNTSGETAVVGYHGVGKDFTLGVQPKDVVSYVYDTIIPQFPKAEVENIATLDNGGTFFCNLLTGDEFYVEGDTSPHHTRILITDPIGLGTIKMISHTIRIVCQNTLQMALDTGTGWAITHSVYTSQYSHIALKSLEKCVGNNILLSDLSKGLGKRMLNTRSVVDILNLIYPTKNGEESTRTKNIKDAVIERFETDSSFTNKSAWALLNAVTYGIQHPTLTDKKDPIKVDFENVFGTRADKKTRALQIILDATA